MQYQARLIESSRQIPVECADEARKGMNFALTGEINPQSLWDALRSDTMIL